MIALPAGSVCTERFALIVQYLVLTAQTMTICAIVVAMEVRRVRVRGHNLTPPVGASETDETPDGTVRCKRDTPCFLPGGRLRLPPLRLPEIRFRIEGSV